MNRKYSSLIYKLFGITLVFFVTIFTLIMLGSLYQNLIFDNKSSSLFNFLNFDIKKAITTLFISSVISFLFCIIFGGLIAAFFIEQNKRENFLNKFYIFILLLNLLIASLAIFNTDQFSVLVGAISLAALVWPRFKS